MKLRRIKLENVRSFLDSAELIVDGDISIIIGPNGGGKTNLLDAITVTLRRFLLHSWTLRRDPQPDNPDRHVFAQNDAVTSLLLERHSLADRSALQVIEIDVEVTQRDIENLAAMKNSAGQWVDLTKRKYYGVSFEEVANWDTSKITPGRRFQYRIVNNSHAPLESDADMFRKFLSLYEADASLRSETGENPLSTPMLSLPVNRAASSLSTAVSLAGYNDFDQKKSVDAATSRNPGSTFYFAVARIARNYRLLLEHDRGDTSKLYAQPEIKSLTSVLKGLGYDWQLVTLNPLNNEYDVRLTKQGSSFLVSAASSGERELLTYLFAVYALNVRDALIIVDEPEMHLHPKWQTTLFELFETLAIDTGNQFLLATHSPIFVSPASIQYVSRVFTRDQRSQIIRLNNENLPEPKHLFSIVNSQNNERLFFTNKVILVEGISDRLIIEAVIKKLRKGPEINLDFEIIDVGGKGFFEAYKSLLDACQIEYSIISDLDYVLQIGGEDVKRLFSYDPGKVKKNVIKNKASKDALSLIDVLEESISAENLDSLREVWSYIKSRHKKLDEGLSEANRKTLDDLIVQKRGEQIFILSKGQLEDYLPEGFRGKGVDTIIRFLNQRDFWEQLSDSVREEFITIIDSALPK